MKYAKPILSSLFVPAVALLLALAPIADGVPSMTPACVPPPSGLVSWWPADGNTNDIADSNNGTLQGNATFASGKVGQAFTFDGTGDFVQVPDSTNLDISSALTVDAWINLAALPPGGTVFAPVVSKWNDLGVNQRAFFLAVLPDGSVRFDVSTNGNFSAASFASGPNSSSSADNAVVVSSPLVSTGTFVHVAGVFDGSSLKVYINGALNNSVATPFATIFQNNEPLLIGAGDLGGDARDFLNGLVDEVEVFSTALLDSDIFAIFNAGTTGKCRTCTPPPGGLVSWWPAENNAVDIADGNNGTLMGATFASGKVGNAFSFNGTTDFVSVPDSASLDITAQLTIDAWIKPDVFNTYKSIVVKGDAFTEGKINYGLQILGSASGEPVVDGVLRFFVFDSGSYFFRTSTVGVPNDGFFHHVAVTVDTATDTAKFYIDGVLTNTFADFTAALPVSTSTLEIGRHRHATLGPVQQWDGLIDELEIFNRTLSAAEIQAIVNAGNAGKCTQGCAAPPADLVSWWPAQNNANDIKDANDGILMGTTFAPGQVGQAFSLDGIDDFVIVPHAENLDMTAAYTVDAWVKIDEGAVATYRPIAVRGDTGANDIEIYVQFASQDLIVAHNRGNGGTFHHVGFADPPKGVLFHLAVVFDAAGAGIQAYYNGVAAAVTQSSGPITAPLDTNKGWWIGKVDHPDFGADGDPPPDFFKGLIDELEIFNRALTADEIRDLYEAGSFGKCSACSHGYWKNHQPDAWTPTGYMPTDTLLSVFPSVSSVPCSPTISSNTLLQALSYKGGPDVCAAARILLRQAVASLLNAAHPGVNFPRSAGEVIADVNAALASGDRTVMLTLAGALDAENNGVCPLD